MDDNIHYNKLIEENMDKGFQVRLVINEFRDTQYIQLRKYFLSYEGIFVPSREGVSVPASIENIYALLDGLLDICSRAEGEEVIKKYYTKFFDDKGERIPPLQN
jgi:Transcriptional Coactivator p15 (PC4)